MNQDQHWHALRVDEAFEALETTPEGLTEEQTRQRLEQYGPNEIESGERVSRWEILLHQFKNPLLIVLFAAAIISTLAGEYADTVVILVVIAINTGLGFFQESSAESALEDLRQKAAPEAEVLRRAADGKSIKTTVKAAEVVPGDVILLEAGSRVPADARIFQATRIEVDESMLTGESLPVAKGTEPLALNLPMADRTNLVYGGTSLTAGRGQAVVFATGEKSEIGEIATLIRDTEKAEAPLSNRTADLSRLLGFLAVGASALTLVLGLIQGYVFQQLFLLALAIAVSAIPEGLPAAMTIALAVGVNRMAKRNALIRQLAVVDTLGLTTAICSDKTGTLTRNEMTVQQLYVGGQTLHVTGVGIRPQGEWQTPEGEPVDFGRNRVAELALHIGLLCNNSEITRQKQDGEERWEVRGDPTEGALVVAAAKAGLRKEELEQAFPRVEEIPFSSDRKFMATFHQQDERVGVYVKGSPETVLALSSAILLNGASRPLTEEMREQVRQQNQGMANQALRVLGLAYREVQTEQAERIREALDDGRSELTFVGLVGMIDPPRPEIVEAVDSCRRAGIRVIMATGDHQLTAKAIAREVGILPKDNERVLTGQDIEQMDETELDEATREVNAFARVSPAHKHRLVESLRRHGHIVAMTGDGVNDAPALQAAEIGVAMGITGTDVTKDTADMVLTDDNFASIVNAVEEGRTVFENVRKVVKFLLSTNGGEVITILISLLLFPVGTIIITPIQILWVNLVTDGLLVAPLAMEPKEMNVMDEPPRHRETPVIDRRILRNILYLASFMVVGTLFVFGYTLNTRTPLHAQTMAFATMAMFQVFNSLNCRSRTHSITKLGLFSNPYLLVGIALSVVLQIIANRVPVVRGFMGTEPLTLADWGLVVAVSSTILVGDELRKLFAQRKNG